MPETKSRIATMKDCQETNLRSSQGSTNVYTCIILISFDSYTSICIQRAWENSLLEAIS